MYLVLSELLRLPAMSIVLRELIRPAAELLGVEVCLVGLPLDFGTLLEGGRGGAVGGPAFIRRELRRYHKTCNLEHDISLQPLRIAEAENRHRHYALSDRFGRGFCRPRRRPPVKNHAAPAIRMLAPITAACTGSLSAGAGGRCSTPLASVRAGSCT